MTQIILDASAEQLAALASAQPDTPANRVRQALKWPLKKWGGVRPGGFDKGNKHSPRHPKNKERKAACRRRR